MPRPLTIGTAGHVDHGKTVLVKALTGKNTDRLAEEARRGISIDLGFAELDLGTRRLSLVDVPGHERFVRTMIAGASGIDMFLLVVAADDGVMPQTREHLTVLRALEIDHGVVAITKSDLADREVRDKVLSEAQNLLPRAPVVEICAPSGRGLGELRNRLADVAAQVDVERVDDPAAQRPVILHIDRAFTIAGRGTVVTGTLWSGRLASGHRVRILPKGQEARVREIQVHDRQLDEADPGQRVALNLAGVDRNSVRRGDVVTSTDSGLRPTFRLDVEICLEQSMADHERVQVHHGTREVPARVVQLEENLSQLRLEAPLMARAGERVVIRRIAPAGTLGGGIVLDPNPSRRGRGTAANNTGGDPGSLGLAKLAVSPPDRVAPRVLEILRADGATPRGTTSLAEILEISRLRAAAALKQLTANGDLVRIHPDVHYPTRELEALTDRAIALMRSRGSITIAQLRDALGITRKYSQALLEHLDSRSVTSRVGDQHVMRRSAVSKR